MLPDDFDFSVLSSPSFKEDAVREEMIAPILRALGYRPSGDVRVERSKALVHPFVMIGTRKHKVNIVPDYTLYEGTMALAVVDAKRPSENITASSHVEQVYSYAVHPETRCEHFALCNGHELVVFHLANLSAPVLRIDSRNINAQWHEVEKALLPRFLKMPVLRTFRPDLGFHVRFAGIAREGDSTSFLQLHVEMIARVTDQLYSAQAGCVLGSYELMGTFDFKPELLAQIADAMPSAMGTKLKEALARSPFAAFTGGRIILDVETHLGKPTKGTYETFIPFEITQILSATYDASFVFAGAQTNVPDDVPQV